MGIWKGPGTPGATDALRYDPEDPDRPSSQQPVVDYLDPVSGQTNMNGDFGGETSSPATNGGSMNSLSDILSGLGGLATGVGNAAGGFSGRAPSPVAGNANAMGTAKAAAWLPFALIGGAVLLVIVLVVSLAKR